ncbi:amidohydrolase [Marinococcus halophilus]|uniref:amidohydrolase n=1 Tax=Marinococcus halophilus TaxID=1371 RepID=UPI0009A6481A|nr:amidohydrolase [Marinococcus halophilus]
MKTLWYNGNIYTMEKEGEQVEAVLTSDGAIEKAGSLSEIEKELKRPSSRRVNLNGSTMYPGFTDSHLHMIGLGETMIQLDLSECTSAEEMAALIKEKTKEIPAGEWVIGEGWNENNFPDRKIFHREELDDLVPGHPLLLTRICRHAALVNTRALDAAGIDKDTPDPEGGIIVKSRQGEPTGYLLDQAADLVKNEIPEVSEEYLHDALGKAVRYMHQCGLTGGHTEDLNYYGGFKRTLNTFRNILADTSFRAHLLVHHEVFPDFIQQGHAYGLLENNLELGAMKIFADGALGGRTALLSRPYNDAPETAGVAIHSREELKQLVADARRENMPVAVHAIGDLALEYVIDALEAWPVPEGVRDRIIHVQIARKDLVERLKALPVALDLQPRFVLSDFPWVEERLGKERLYYSFAWKTLLDQGIVCAGSSDAPIESVDPRTGIYAAVARKNPGEKHDGYRPEEKLTPYEAVDLYTGGSAKAISREHDLGRIAPGYKADFTILQNDLFQIEPEEILTTEVEATVVGDEVVFYPEKSSIEIINESEE